MTTMVKKIGVLVVEDSPTARELLVEMLNDDPEIEVVGEAKNGAEAVALTKRLTPDLITMDIRMPVMDGLEATTEIMAEQPTPIVVVSGYLNQGEVTGSVQALSNGALAAVAKPTGPQDPDFEKRSQDFIRTVKTMSQVRVVRHLRKRGTASVPVRETPHRTSGVKPAVIAVTVSTGGPAALHELLSGLPRDFPTPIMVVQHMTPGFVGGLSHWLDAVSSLRVKIAEDGERLEPRTVYLAPENRHLGVSVSSVKCVALSDAPPIKGLRPAGTYLFASVAKVFGRAVVAVIMTGMGDDGVAGLRAVRQAGGRIVAQDDTSSVVFGMPAAAIDAGFADVVLPLSEIAGELASRVHTKASRASSQPGHP